MSEKYELANPAHALLACLVPRVGIHDFGVKPEICLSRGELYVELVAKTGQELSKLPLELY
jgi:hypothetical protein